IEDAVLDYDMANNTILALDRGEKPPMSDVEDHKYMIKRLTNRMKKPDFVLLTDQIKQTYQERLNIHNTFLISQQQEAEQAKAGFIPTGGGLVGVDVYVPGPDGKSKRARLPNQSIDWLIKKLGAQGIKAEEVDELPLSAQASIGKGMAQQQQAQPQQEASVAQLPVR
ncbi:unnamed protein product, partial [marine sediment metagenome]